MLKCIECGQDPEPQMTPEFLTVSGVRVDGLIQTMVCPCGEQYMASAALARFERRVALQLIRSGVLTGPTFKYARKAMGWTRKDLAKLLEVTTGYIEDVESDMQDPGNCTWYVLASILSDKLASKEDTVLRLSELTKRPFPVSVSIPPE